MHFITENLFYDGRQLSHLYAYLNHQILGPSIVSWVGPCEVSLEKMVDGEDLLAGEKICGSQMLHFIVELFREDLVSMVLLQRLFASQIQQRILEDHKIALHRQGDDLYLGQKKLSISIACSSIQSVLMHFAMNITNEGTPVPTVSLSDLGIQDVRAFAEKVMVDLAQEYGSVLQATYKVKSV